MKILIVGPGAMGCLFAGKLIESGEEDVWLLDRNIKRAREIQKNGIRIEGIGGTRRIVNIRATAIPEDIDNAHLVIIFVKSYDTHEACHRVSPAVGKKTAVLTLQNGLTNVDIISSIIGKDKVIAGITSHGATLLDTGHIKHAGEGDTIIGEPYGVNLSRTQYISKLLTSAGFKTTVTNNIYSAIWGKAVINAAINPLTAITGLLNGELLEHKETRHLIQMIVEEAVKVAGSKDIDLPYENAVKKVEAVCKATSSNVSSMLQDIKRGKQTEIDAINGAIVMEAHRSGIPADVNEILTCLVKTIQRSMKTQK
ncbi:2-dehydropantoate 2-reductase [Candidatus Poribacteria bacterium]|nr:2-dehydropantoate 2-reductase [Candidatus Poribacteria bacterium]